MFLAPGYHRVDERDERQAQFGNGILAAWWQFGIDRFEYQPVVHQFFELQIEHARSGFRQSFVQLAWTQVMMPQLIQDAGFPLGTNEAERQPKRTVQINRNLSFVHT